MSIEERVARSHDVLDALLAGLSVNDETQEVLASLWQQLPPRRRAEVHSPDLAAHALLGYLGDDAAWESPRLRDAREALKRFVPNADSPSLPALLADETHRFAFTFGGQAATYFEELAALAHTRAAPLIAAVSQRLKRRAAQFRDEEQALIGHDFAVDTWLANEASRPAARALRNATVSYPLIFTTQIARYALFRYAGYDQPRLGGRVVAAAGHSQGVLAALCAAETFGHADLAERAADYAELALMLGLRMQQAFPTVALPPQVLADALKDGVAEPTPMAALHGLTDAQLHAALATVAALGAPLTLALDNAPLRKIVAGHPADLERLRRALAQAAVSARKAKAAGRHAGRVPDVEWQYLDVSAPFHTPYMASALARVQADASELGFRVGALEIPVLDTDTGRVLAGDVLTQALRGQCVAPVSWRRDIHTLVEMGTTCVLDFGPSDGLARLSSSNLKGCGVPVLAIATEAGERAALDPRERPQSPGPRYHAFVPTLGRRADGSLVLENRFTRVSGRPPVFLAGMTPTTVETPIVGAAVNAGYIAELAGGGQVTEPMLRQRLRELQATLVPGQGIVFNALYLDPYLWKLHFGPDRLVIKLRDEGFPILGVTVSAGIPPVDEAVALLRELVRHGIHWNAFKPGNDEQLKQVFAIADACPEITIGVQIEGGKAGGHHSWEDLDDLLWRHYAALRARANIVLAVGGGIGTPAKASRYLRGTWHEGKSPVPMPVDAVFIGTVAMAAKEANTSPAVKQALARAEGTGQWVLDGDSRGQVTSGRSGLDASIYYLDNAAAEAARLLDRVAGKAAEVARRKREIVAALARTAKPYFGDLPAMSYQAVLERLLALTCIGTGTPYEDGVWPDVSYRRRFLAVLQAAEARLSGDQRAPFRSIVQHERELDDPHAVVVRFAERYPHADDVLMHPHDVQRFIEICRRPGKPVSFVPVIDAEVRRWYKADSLWQAHAGRYSADEVLTIPGPEAVAGITRVDEPIADILGRFVEQTTRELAEAGAPVRSLDHVADVLLPLRPTQAAEGELRADEVSPERWLGALAELGRGPLTAALVAPFAVTAGAPARTVRNLLRDLLAHRPGLVLQWRTDEHGRLASLTARTDRVFARLSLGATGEGCTTLSASLVSDTRRTTTPEEVALDLGMAWRDAAQPTGALVWDRERYLAGQADFYGRLLFGATLTPAPLFAAASEDVTLDAAAIAAYVAATGDDSQGLTGPAGATHAPLGMAFVIAWKAIFRALCGASIDVLSLLHEENDTRGEDQLRDGQRLEVSASVQSLEPLYEGLRLVTRAEIRSAGARVATVTSRFFVRGHATCDYAARGRFVASMRIKDEGDLDFLCGRPWLTITARPAPGDLLVLDCATWNQQHTAAGLQFTVQGVLRRGGDAIGTVAVADGTHAADCRPDAIAEACRLLAAAPEVTPIAARELGSEQVTTPASMLLYARASGDFNPIHLDPAVARFAGLGAPIVHGMWTAAAALHRGTRLTTGGDVHRVRRFQARFTAPVARGEALTIAARQVGLQAGGPVVELEASVQRGDERLTVLTGVLEAAAPRTAYVFPGQGIQAPGMGMTGYARSKAARAVWDEAERICRAQLGFSLLRVVRDNPQELHVGSERFVHPKGVLYLTQFTQVAMLVLAVAQMRELRELGAYVPDARFCGHSVGEYSALAAVAEVVPLANMIEVVYHRGLTMDQLIERTADGRSPYAMGVVRPHYAGLDEAGVHDVVAEVAGTLGLPLEIVNYNIKGRQYSVTGDVRALERLGRALAERQAARRVGEIKPAYLEVPGIDVPFHSSLLRPGVDGFRKTLEQALPTHIDHEALVDRYIPNLVAKPFRLAREFVAEVAQVSQSPRLQQTLENWDRVVPETLARTLLIELLAYQFASPVRWIETQDILLDAQSGVERFIEVGVAEQPTLANMAHATLGLQRGRLTPPLVLNSEAHFSELAGPVPPSPPQPPATAVSAAAPSAPASASPEPAPARPARTARTAAPAAVADVPVSVADALRTLLALQAKVRPDQLADGESLDELLGGNSARRNQLLADIGAEFGVGAIDGAHELPLRALGEALLARAAHYSGAGKYLAAQQEQGIARALGAARLARKDVMEHLQGHWKLGPGRIQAVLNRVAVQARQGDSMRGGGLSDPPAAPVRDRASALAWLDGVVEAYGREVGVSFASQSASDEHATAVDSAALDALGARVLGKDGVLARTARQLQVELGIDPDAGRAVGAPTSDPASERLALYDREHGKAYADAIAPLFSADRHVAFTSAWAWVKRDVVALYHRLVAGEKVAEHALLALARRLDPDTREVARTLAHKAAQAGHGAAARALARVAEAGAHGQAFVPSLTPQRPTLAFREGEWRYGEAPRAGEADAQALVRACGATVQGHITDEPSPLLPDTLADQCRDGLRFAGRTALVTGAGPGSIALALTRILLEGGARVIVTTSRYHDARLALYKRLYQECAGEGAELHVVPANQASFTDIDALLDWLFASRSGAKGAAELRLKDAWVPDILVPFGAIGETADLTSLSELSQITLRVLLIGVERLVGGIAARLDKLGLTRRRCHVLLPLSPNHGAFGGDGLYGESKAALEALLDKWQSEQRSWGRLISLVGARIGWVRGTGLMDANDLVAARLEADTGLRTFAADEMALLLAGLVTDEARAAAAQEPLVASLTGGMEKLADLAGRAADIRRELHETTARHRRRTDLEQRLQQALGEEPAPPLVVAPAARVVVEAPVPTPAELAALPPLDHLDRDRVVAIVGFGEVSPWGSARTRWAIERSGELSLEAVAELAWMMGLIQPSQGPATGTPGSGWIDVETGAPVDDLAIKQKYEARVLSASGIRFIATTAHAFDPNAALGFVDVHLDRDLAFPVPSRDAAETFRKADPEHTRVFAEADGSFTVVRQRGAVVKMPRALRLDRQVSGLIPEGWDATRYGISRQMVEQVDRVTLFNLVATVEAFVSAGLEPEELYTYLHPSRVGITQASGIGGMQKLRRMYQDFALGNERQNDTLQETLINVMAGYVVQTYLGSYGPMSFPVAACATAALSLGSGVEKIMTGAADFVVTGGADDLREEGVVGFADMAATCNSDEMQRHGISPGRISRPNDRRRGGFVEAQGAGALLLCRGSLALRAGLPVYGIVAYAGSFGDGINQSVPAPGLGVLAAAAEAGAPSDPLDACGFAERRAAIAAVEARRVELTHALGEKGAAEIIRATRRRYAHEFHLERDDISPLRGALAAFGLTPDDLAVVSKHDTSTAANDVNENRLHTWLQEKLGRTRGLPLLVISQKSLTGHPKGAAAAWQMNGLLQAMADGVVPGNQSLDDVDPAMREFAPMTFTDTPIRVGRLGLRAGLVTSLGFGHVGSIVCLVHPFCFWRMLSEDERTDYARRVRERTREATRRLQAALGGHAPMYVRRTERPFTGREGTAAHLRHEAESLTDLSVRLDRHSGLYAAPTPPRAEGRPS